MSKKSVLLIEDDQDCAHLIAESLSGLGFKYIWFASTVDTAANLLNLNHDLIIADLKIIGGNTTALIPPFQKNLVFISGDMPEVLPRIWRNAIFIEKPLDSVVLCTEFKKFC